MMATRIAAAAAEREAAKRRMRGASFRRTAPKNPGDASIGTYSFRSSQARANSRQSAHEAAWARASDEAAGWVSLNSVQLMDISPVTRTKRPGCGKCY